MSAAPLPELAADLELGALCTASPPIAATVVLAAVLLVELATDLELGALLHHLAADRRRARARRRAPGRARARRPPR